MKKSDILYSALVVTVLTINPLFTSSLNASVNRTNFISSSVANILARRGINDDAAKEIAEEFFADKEEEFALMLKNIANGCSVLSENEIMDHISSLALHRKNIELDSYASLVNMVQKIKNISPSKETLKELQNIADINSLYAKKTS